MSYDDLVCHLNYEDIYCDNASNPHKCLLLYSVPIECKGRIPKITCNGPCSKTIKLEEGFFHCKECNWDLCLDCMSIYHPELIDKRCVKSTKVTNSCPLKCSMADKLNKS